ncbi:hypothetical protein Leryth_024719 [Lithospermum erythrorhizon]|nr:hypothetical protein Leryth_024719 [Lithospermum erythrorhizon]
MCLKWWIPSILSICTSLVIAFLVQLKLFRYWKACGQLQREKNDNRALTRCIQELRMKGASFDLMKEPQNGRRMKSSSVEIKWRPITWFSQYLGCCSQLADSCSVLECLIGSSSRWMRITSIGVDTLWRCKNLEFFLWHCPSINGKAARFFQTGLNQNRLLAVFRFGLGSGPIH